jgi:hypothetical protein
MSGKVVQALLFSTALLSIALRYPAEHEIGVDSFFIHTLAESITRNGHAVWASNLLAYFGWYPASYASGAPFLLSATSQIAQVEMEPTIMLTSMVLGSVGLFTAFIMAREFRPHPSFALGVAMIYATAPRFLLSTLWQASTRNLFMAIFPLLVWSLVRFYRTHTIKDLSVCSLVVVALASAHRLVALVPLVILAYLVSAIILRAFFVFRRTHPRFVMARSRRGETRWAALVLTFGAGVGLLFGTSILGEYSVGELATGSSPPVELLNLAVSLTRSIGLAAPLALFGLALTPWIKNLGFPELFCIVAVIAMIPTLSLRLYTGFYVLPFLAVIGGFGLHAIHQRLALRGRVAHAVVVAIAFSVILSSGLVLQYEQRLNPPMSMASYGSSLYLAQRGQQVTLVCNHQTTCSQIAAIGGVRAVPTAGGTPDAPSPEILIFGFYNKSELSQHIGRVSFEDLTFNSNSLLTVIGLDPQSDYVNLVGSSLDRIPPGLSIRYQPMYYLEITAGVGVFFGDNGVAYASALGKSVRSQTYCVYQDGFETVWWIFQK